MGSMRKLCYNAIRKAFAFMQSVQGRPVRRVCIESVSWGIHTLSVEGCFNLPFEKESTPKGKNLLPIGANSFLSG